MGDEKNPQDQQVHNARLAWIIENTREPVVVTDPERLITWCNQAFLDVTGYALDDVLGRNPGHFLQGPGTDPDTVAWMSEQLQLNQTFICEVLNYSRTGNPYWIRLSVQPRFSKQGELLEYIAIQNDITEEHRIRTDLEDEVRRRKSLEAHLRHIAQHDEMTELPNRRLFMDRADHSLKRLRRYGGELSVVLADLDHFKTINDQFGHAVGDEVLRRFSRLSQDLIRETDLVARLGGEEFAFLLPETSLEDAMSLAERVRVSLAEAPLAVTRPDGVKVEVPATISMGVSSTTTSETVIDRLLADADKALYQAKNSGRNQVRRYSPPQ